MSIDALPESDALPGSGVFGGSSSSIMDSAYPPKTPDPLSTGRRWLKRTVLAFALGSAVCIGGAVALSKTFQDGSTRIFSKVVDGVKDHPRGTLAVCLGGVTALWLGIGLIAVGQEWRGRRTHR